MEALAEKPAEFAHYLAKLGQTVPEVEERLGRKLKPAELKAWRRGQKDRILLVRAVESHWMHRGDLKKLPRWATKVHPDG
jgi:hypothetical protein